MSPPHQVRRPTTAGNDLSDAVDLAQQSDTRTPVRLGFWVLVVGFGLFLTWAALAPLDEGLPVTAVVSIETRRNLIQHVQGGVIKQLAVKEGQQVKAGEVLLLIDDGATRAAHESIRQNYLSQRALESRLLAELAGANRIHFHPDVQQATEAEARLHMSAQTQLFNARGAALAAEVAASEEAIAGLQVHGRGLGQVIESRSQQAALLSEQVNNVRALAQDGFAPRNQALALEQTQAELKAGMADLQANLQRVATSIAETRFKIAQRRQEHLKEGSAQLTEVRREVQANQERLAAVRAELARTEIRSPADGQVVALALSGAGGVVAPGQKMMEIVPVAARLLLDAKLPPHAIDRVRVGDATEVRFSGFADSPQLVVGATLVSLATDSVTEQIGGSVMTYYLGRVAITDAGLKALGPRVMQPGMPAEVLIRTGERSLLTYLLHPLTKRIAAAMKEE